MAQQERFQEAAAYAKDAAQTEAIYAEEAKGTAMSAYNVAVADWFHPPEVDELDLTGYTGEVGETIRTKVAELGESFTNLTSKRYSSIRQRRSQSCAESSVRFPHNFLLKKYLSKE